MKLAPLGTHWFSTGSTVPAVPLKQSKRSQGPCQPRDGNMGCHTGFFPTPMEEVRPRECSLVEPWGRSDTSILSLDSRGDSVTQCSALCWPYVRDLCCLKDSLRSGPGMDQSWDLPRAPTVLRHPREQHLGLNISKDPHPFPHQPTTLH